LTKQHHSFNCEQFLWDELTTEADKEGISINALLQNIVTGYVKHSEVLPIVTNYDIEIKKAKLDEIKQNVRRKNNDNTFFEKNGYYPTKPASFVTRIVETQKQKVWQGDKFGSVQQFATTVEPKITDISESEWEILLPTLCDFDQNKKMYYCFVNGCGFGCQQEGTIKQHMIDNHEDILQKNLRALKSW